MLITSIALLFTLTVLFAIYMRMRKFYTYWQLKNIPFIKPTPIIGNLGPLLTLRISFGDFFKKIYDEAGRRDASIIGIYLLHSKPAILIREPELIKRIFIKNFDLFLNRYEAADGQHDSMGHLTLPLAKYKVWRESRKRMAEFFTSGKLKERMYPLMLEVSLSLENHLKGHFLTQDINENSEAIIEVKELCALYTTDITALLSFSIRANSLNGNLKIRDALAEMLNPTFIKGLNFFIIFFLPHLTSLTRAKVFPSTYVQFIKNILEYNLKRRHNASLLPPLLIGDDDDDGDNMCKEDLIDLLLNFQNESKFEKRYEFSQHPDFIASQVAIMLIAGFETSSSLIAFILYELAKQPEIQKILRSEIIDYLNNNKQKKINECPESVSYESLQQMTYLNMVVAEGLRMYPTAAFINREFTPGRSEGTFSLEPFAKVDLERGIPVYVSILGLHRDEKYWPNSHQFDPERFRAERASSINPMTYIPFGVGPHACIGSRLGVIQVKLGLIHILKGYIVETCETSPKEIVFEPKSFMLQNRGGIELKFIRIYIR